MCTYPAVFSYTSKVNEVMFVVLFFLSCHQDHKLFHLILIDREIQKFNVKQGVIFEKYIKLLIFI
jgi:hypothetical protein